MLTGGAIALSGLLHACAAGGNSAPTPIRTDPAFAAPRPTADSAYFVRCTPRPLPIPMNRMFAMDVAVFTDSALTQPAATVRIHPDADMPEHGHGMTLSPRTARTGPGAFRVDGMLMHMPGAWEIYIDVENDGVTSRATFPVVVE